MADEGTGAFHRLAVAGRKATWLASGGLFAVLLGGLETFRSMTERSADEILAEAHQICLTQLEEQAEAHRREMRQELAAQFDRFMEAIKLMQEE